MTSVVAGSSSKSNAIGSGGVLRRPVTVQQKAPVRSPTRGGFVEDSATARLLPMPEAAPRFDPRAGRRHRRNPKLNREAILAAAAATFAQWGYQKATLREIARRAEVTHGLVLRHFGSKEQLFLAAIPGAGDLGEVAQGPLETLPERLAAGYVERMEQSDSDPLLAVLRSAAVGDLAAAQLLEEMERSSTDVYRQILGHRAAEQMAPFLASLLLGVTFQRYILPTGVLANLPVELFQSYLTDSIRALLAGYGPD